MEIPVNIKNSRSKYININRDLYLKYLEIMKALLNTTTKYFRLIFDSNIT